MSEESAPLCPNCESELPANGVCWNCDYETNRNYITGEADKAFIDNDWEKEVPVISTLKVYEHSESGTFSSSRPSFPYVCWKANYPGGNHRGKIPMVSKGLPFEMAHLHKVVRVERPSPNDITHPYLIAVYSRSQGEQDVMMKVSVTDEEYEIEPFHGDDRLVGEVTEVLWSAEWRETTHPLNDIELGDHDMEKEDE